MREKNGYAVIELTHDGIPSAELKPEAFNDIQLQVLNELDCKMQTIIRSGKPVIVMDMATGQKVCAVFISGSEDLRESIRDLLIYNKYRLDEIEYRKAHKDNHFFSPWWSLYQDHGIRVRSNCGFSNGEGQ